MINDKHYTLADPTQSQQDGISSIKSFKHPENRKALMKIPPSYPNYIKHGNRKNQEKI